jgi:hypothetical protein
VNRPSELPREVYQDSILGQFAIAVLGDEPAGELFSLLTIIMSVRMTDGTFVLEGENIDMTLIADLPIIFCKPYHPKTIEIVRHLEKLGYLKLDKENDRGSGYTIIQPAKDERASWTEAVLKEIEKFAIRPVSAQFTHAEQIKIMNAAGISVGNIFEFQFNNGTKVELQLTPERIEVFGERLPAKSLTGVIAIWMLAAYGDKHNLGSFASPTTDEDLEQVVDVINKVNDPLIATRPLEEIIPFIETSFRTFWTSRREQSGGVYVS